MPITPTNPGVYVEEVSSGVRTIVGVATSVTAFVGRAERGPVEEPKTVNTLEDYARLFGGIWEESPMSYAVRDYFLNGGSQAIIVRLYRKNGSERQRAVLDLEGLELEAKSEGAWANTLRGRITISSDRDDAKAFDLYVHDESTGVVESFLGVTIEESKPRFVTEVVKAESNLVTVNRTPRTVKTNKPAGTRGIVAEREAWTDDNSTRVKDTNRGSDGSVLDDAAYEGNEDDKAGIFALEDVEVFNMLCIPPSTMSNDVGTGTVEVAIDYCERRRAFMIVDPPKDWSDTAKARTEMGKLAFRKSDHAAIYFPRLRSKDPDRGGRIVDHAPCGAIAGMIARTDSERGVWKAPAGLEATIKGFSELSVVLSDAENGELNPIGLNCIRSNVAGLVVWGARTLLGDDRHASEYKYVPIRRTALHIENSLRRGLQWAVFEPNDEPLWAQIRLNVGTFMQGMFGQGAFAGTRPKDAYFVKCDGETTTAADRDLGVVNILVGFAPLKPAEFVIVKIGQLAGQTQS